MDRRRFLAGLGAAGVVGLAGCTAGASDGQDYDIGTTATRFHPPEFTTSVGTEVVWKNTSSRAHTVTAYESHLPDGAAYFASGGYDTEQAARNAFYDKFGGALDSGETFSHTFEDPGTYHYFCIPHEQAGMVGKVVVQK
ncbi:MAG: plastocyanin/azurin family copper-binding protein [Salinigranum sp.]